MLSIHLHNILLHGHHGIYGEERVLGNLFELNITIKHLPRQLPVLHLADTVDYIAVYELVKKRMAIATPLLETLATEIATQILAQFSLSEEVFISIRKLHPPVSRLKGSVGVSFTLTRKDL